MSTNEDPHNITEIGYVVCPSSTPVPAGVVPNKTNRFTVHLARPIDTSKIRGEIEVALVEISLPHSWAITFPAKRCEYEVYVADITPPHQNPVRRRACLPAGTPVKDYGSVEELLVGLNERRPRLENIPNKIWAGKFRMSSTGKVQLCLFEGEALEMSSDLAGALGFEQTVFNFIEGKVGDELVFLPQIEQPPDPGPVAIFAFGHRGQAYLERGIRRRDMVAHRPLAPGTA